MGRHVRRPLNTNRGSTERRQTDENAPFEGINRVLDSLPAAILLLDRETLQVTFANTAASRLLGSDLNAGHFADADGHPVRPWDLPWARLSTGESPKPENLEWISPGQRVPVVVSCSFLQSADSSPAIAVSIEDVSAFARTVREMREASRGRDEFLSLVAHELRSPLTSLQLHAYSLLRPPKKEGPNRTADEVARKAESINHLVSRMGRLITGLLEVARLRTGRMVLEPALFDLSEAVQVLVSRFQSQFKRAGAEVLLSLPPELPALLDRERVEIALSHVLSSAAGIGGGQPIRIALEAAEGGARIEARCQSRRAVLPKQEDLQRQIAAGRGIGTELWLAHQLLDAMGGSLTVTAPSEAEAVLTVVLPLK